MNSKENQQLFYTLLYQILLQITDKDTYLTENQKSIIQQFQRSDKDYSEIKNEILNISNISDSYSISQNIESNIMNSKNNFVCIPNNRTRSSQLELDINRSSENNSPSTPDSLKISLNSTSEKKFNFSSTSFNYSPLKNSSTSILNSFLTSNSNQIKNNYKIDSTLPFIIISVNATLNANQILDLIYDIFNGVKYKGKDSFKRSEVEISLILEKNYSKLWYFFCCKKKKAQIMVSILLKDKINIKNENKYERKISIKSITGEEESIEKDIIFFLKRLIKYLTHLHIIKKSKIFNNYNFDSFISNYFKRKKTQLTKKSKKLVDDDNIYFALPDDQNDKSIIDFSQEEANRVFDIYKLLSSDTYSLGKSLNEFLELFKAKYSNTKNLPADQINTKNIMNEVTDEIGECLQTFTISFNSSYAINNNDDKEYVRQSIEQYIFNKIYFLIFEIYQKKYNEEDNKFEKSQNEIKNKKSVNEIFEYLEVKKKFRSQETIPFKISIELLNKLEYEQSPKKKFEIITQSNLELRNSILDITKGKAEIESMDDELPLIIYLSTQVSLKNFVSQLSFIDDYLKCTLKDDSFQNKMITNLLSSARYISYNWEDNKK